ncbi:FFLEELY motif protein [Marinobacter sp. GN3S48]|uniref:FFLEELY motif protein n=1 Tax=Marinobacter sp. GN3S48 TaxID=3382302 RepID=UPI00387AA816
MYRERLVATEVHSDSARRLQYLLINYHDFRQRKASHPLLEDTFRIADWQAERLKRTHQDLYQHPGYHTGLEFLLTDLYAPATMTRRDDNIDRVFPKMVKWLPDNLLDTFAGLVELNLITQRLDLDLTETLRRDGVPSQGLTSDQYCAAFRASPGLEQRHRQIALVAEVGQQLDHYVRNRTLGWLLSMTRGPAEMADLSDLHSFLHRGYTAFRKMEDVDALIERLVTREARVLDNILNRVPEPFNLPDDL